MISASPRKTYIIKTNIVGQILLVSYIFIKWVNVNIISFSGLVPLQE